MVQILKILTQLEMETRIVRVYIEITKGKKSNWREIDTEVCHIHTSNANSWLLLKYNCILVLRVSVGSCVSTQHKGFRFPVS